MAALCATFHSLDGLAGTGTRPESPWSVEILLSRYRTASSGERACIKFVLEVYNPGCVEGIGRFTLDDFASMDRGNQAAFAAWARDPWWA